MLQRLFLIFIACFTHSLTHAQPDDNALVQLVSKLQATNTFQAKFIQTSKAQEGHTLQQIQGNLSVAQPGKMRWETDEPYAQLVVSDGQLIWVYDMDLEQVSVRNMGNRVQETPALLLSGNSDQINASFIVSREDHDSVTVFRLIPKDPSQLFQSLQFHYDGTVLTQMMIFDAADQVTQITFSDQQMNQPIDEQAFIFDVPEGVDVIDGRKSF